MYQLKPLKFKKEPTGISQKTLEIHHDKLYKGYVDKSNEIKKRLTEISISENPEGNQTYSELRGLKNSEGFANNGVYLHEGYFAVLGGNGEPSGELARDLSEKYGSTEQFKKYFSACGMAARGWTVLAWDINTGELRIFNADDHSQGGIWGAMPIIVLDVYEHAYFIDYGSDRKKYIEDFWKNLDWEKANELYLKASKFRL